MSILIYKSTLRFSSLIAIPSFYINQWSETTCFCKCFSSQPKVDNFVVRHAAKATYVNVSRHYLPPPYHLHSNRPTDNEYTRRIAVLRVLFFSILSYKLICYHLYVITNKQANDRNFVFDSFIKNRFFFYRKYL